MNDLIERLEKATGPDRELDAELVQVIGWRRDGAGVWWSPEDGRGKGYYPAPTASIDAALTLVPEGWVRAVDATVPADGIDVDLFPSSHGLYRGSHKSEAIATCIAALKARAAMKTPNNESEA